MKENHLKEALRGIMNRDVPENMNLWPRIRERVDRKSFMQTVRSRPALAVFLVVLALALLTGVAYAFGKVTGYIRGVGLVNQNTSLRLLAEPVKVKQSGLTITIKQMVTDADRTFVTYRVDGLSPSTTNRPITCEALPFLQLPNGSTLLFMSSGGRSLGGEMGILRLEVTAYYPPIPIDVDHVKFVFPCILPEGTGPENWQIPLNLSPAPEGYVLPAVEIGATFIASTPRWMTTSVSTPAADGSSFPKTVTPVPNGSGLYLEKAVELDNSYLLIGNFTDLGDLPGFLLSGSAQQSIPYEFHVTDRDGKPVSFSFRPDLMPSSSSDLSNVTHWALELRKPLSPPITITLPEISTLREDAFQFQVDVGTNPVIGQTWNVGKTVEVAGYSFRIEDVTYVEHGYTLKLRSPLSRENVFIELQLEKHIAQQAYERFYNRDGYVDLAETLSFKDEPPTGILIFTLHIDVDSPIGPWTLTWSPPGK